MLYEYEYNFIILYSEARHCTSFPQLDVMEKRRLLCLKFILFSVLAIRY